MSTLVPVLLAGGSGTRLWPTSRKSYPKQFVDLADSGRSLLQATLKRAEVMNDPEPWIIVTSEDYRFLVAQQAQEVSAEIGSILLEPSARNTAPAIALAALDALSRYEQPKLIVQTADHHIENVERFGAAITKALTSEEPFVLFGVKPTHPETGYGYIEVDHNHAAHEISRVDSFKEKPDHQTAQQYVQAGNYLWNSGMFLLDAERYLRALEQFEPGVFAACAAAFATSQVDLDFTRIDAVLFAESPSISIDYAVMERLDTLHVMPYDGDWSDVGAWDAVANLTPTAPDGNTTQGETVLIDSSNTFVRAESRLVAGIGLDHLVIVETRDAVLVADSRKTQDVKKLVDSLKASGHKVATEHQKMYRPWGSYETLVLGTRFQVKQIIVNPGSSLSLQMHHHRAEHWVVVSGTAEVQVNDTTKLMTEDQSIYIPIGATHRLTNPGKLPLTLIEVQSGGYLGEDDIVRFEDVYGRTGETTQSS